MVTPITADEGTAVAEPVAPPTRTGYTFRGWFDEAEGGAPYSWPHTLIADVTMHAQWRAITYTVEYNANGGNGSMASVAHTYDEPQNLTANTFTRSAYFFAGWNTQEGGGGTSYDDEQSVSNLSSTQGATVTLYAKWTNIIYTVTFESHGGSAVTAVSGPEGTQAAKPADPIRNGYTFGGWFDAETGGTEYTWPHTLAANVTMHAQWTAIDYSITYNLYGGTNGANPATYTIESNAITLADATRNGYTFGGWYSDAGFITSVTGIPAGSTGAKTFYAKWEAITYTVKYNANGGSGTTSSSVHTYGVYRDLTANAFTKTGYSFGGWNTQVDGAGTSYSDEATLVNLSSIDGAEVNLYAKWEAITYTVVYNSNGGDGGATASSTHTYDVPENLTANGFTRTGYTFAGWSDSAVGSVSYANTESVENLTTTKDATVNLYAQWTVVSYTITYELNGGTNGANPAGYTIESAPITLVAPSRMGYEFWGWYSDSGFTTSVTGISTGSTGNKTFHAKWNPGALIQITLQPVLDPLLTDESMFVDGVVSFSTTETGYTFWEWYWNGTLQSSGADADTYTLADSLKIPGIYELSVVVTTDEDVKLSARCRVTVKAR
jgi:uncharacterized repeat protein (TIGR02543 family)